MISAIISGGSIGFLVVLCVFLIIECWSLKMDLEHEKSMREVDIKFKEHYRKEWSKEYDLHMEYEKKYNQLLKNFQRYIDEHGDKQHQCNCYKKGNGNR